MKNLIKRLVYYFNKPTINLVISFLVFYFVTYLSHFEDRKIYKLELSCAEVVKVNDTSDYKTQPSIIIKKGSEEIEIYQFYSYDYDFKQFELGDKVCKEANNFNFIRIKNDNALDTITDDSRKIISALLFMPLRPYDERKLNCNCI